MLFLLLLYAVAVCSFLVDWWRVGSAVAKLRGSGFHSSSEFEGLGIWEFGGGSKSLWILGYGWKINNSRIPDEWIVRYGWQFKSSKLQVTDKALPS